MDRLRTWFPRGRALPPNVWAMRHRGLLLVLAAHLLVLPLFAVCQGWSVGAALLFDVAPAVLGAAAAVPRLSRAWRSSLCALALLACSAAVVVAWHGTTEAHFHYFVVVGALALYEEWWAYLLAIGFVVVQHTVIGALHANAVFTHAHGSAWRWAVVHGLFIAGLAFANLISWRANERVRADTARSQERFRRAFEDAPVSMALVDPSGRVLQANRELRVQTGRETTDLLRFWDLHPPADRDALRASWPPRPGVPDSERRYLRADGTLGWIHWRHSLILGADGQPDHYISQGVDITARKHDAERLDHQAHHDPLTGLPNRALFDRVLAAALERRRETGSRLAVLFADIDDFKVINDSLGHRAGDELLVSVAERLATVVRPDDTIARFGGDEFVILLERVPSLADVRRVADRVAAEVRRPFVLEGRSRYLSASLGVAVADGSDVQAEELLRDADAAMYQAKEHGKARLEFFDSTVRTRAVERLELEAELRDALARGELSLVYQPEIALADTTLFGTEALLRWQHPVHGHVSPMRFVPIAEQSGLIVPIGQWVLEQACRQAALWRAEGREDFVMAVNLSPRQLSSPDLADCVATALAESGLPPSSLCLEITESAIMEDPEAAHRILQGLRALGVRLAIDDFGVGYSSLSHLKYLLPVDMIKIDKTFVDGLLDDGDSRAIITAIVELAHALGVQAVAEGVETADQALALRSMGCHTAQGYHFARPLPPYLLAHSEHFGGAPSSVPMTAG